MKVRSGFIKVAAVGWIQQEKIEQAERRGLPPPNVNVIMGLVDSRLRRWMDDGEDFIYLDHAYFNRGWSNNMFRAVRKACHLNTIKKRPDDRMKKFGVQVEPWRKQRGSKIVVIPTYQGHEIIWPGMHRWVDETVFKIQKHTDRPIAIKREKGNLRAYLEDAWCLVCNQSVAGMEAALMGIPVFATEKCCTAPVSAGPIENIENPEFPDNRHEWAASLAYASWAAEEIDEVNWIDYDYSLCDDLPS